MLMSQVSFGRINGNAEGLVCGFWTLPLSVGFECKESEVEFLCSIVFRKTRLSRTV